MSSFPSQAPSAHFDLVGSRVFACLGVAWQNDCGLYCATAVTRGWNEYRVSQHRKLTGEENSPAAPAAIQTGNLSITSPALLPTSFQRTCVPTEICILEVACTDLRHSGLSQGLRDDKTLKIMSYARGRELTVCRTK